MKLNFKQQGNPNAKPVILIHGLFGSLSNLSSLGRYLAESWKIYQVDLRNHGASAHSHLMNLDCMASDIIELMDEQDLTTADILGHSLGGKVAMQTALNYPNRVSQIVVADIAPVQYPPQHDAVFAALHALDQAEIKQRSTALSILEDHIDEPNIRAFLLKNLVRTKTGRYKLRINLSGIFTNYSRLNAIPRGTPFVKPVLFIKGAQSDYITQAHRDPILTLFPNASFKMIDAAGHWLHADKPAAFNYLVKRFLLTNTPR